MQESLYKLPVTRQISPYLSLRQKDQLPLLVVSHPKVSAVIALQGAQLLSWQPSGEKPVIWLSDKTPFREGTAIRGEFPSAGLGLAQQVNPLTALPVTCLGAYWRMMKANKG